MLGYGAWYGGDNVGDDPGEMSALPAVDVGSGRTVLDVALAGDSTCLLLDHGGVRCFGVANGGNFGDPRNNGETTCDGAAASPPWSPGYLCMVQVRPTLYYYYYWGQGTDAIIIIRYGPPPYIIIIIGRWTDAIDQSIDQSMVQNSPADQPYADLAWGYPFPWAPPPPPQPPNALQEWTPARCVPPYIIIIFIGLMHCIH